MNGNEMLKKLGRLSEITSMKDVRQLTTAMFPGTHCPLMGAAMAVRGIQDAYMLLVGTDECAYYTKHMTLYSQDFGGVDGRCLSVVLDAQNVTFGCAAKMEEAFDELVRDKTSIYISHRMSSCRFCQDILVFQEGRLVERGSHETLLEAKGLYASLWNAQAQYYVK